MLPPFRVAMHPAPGGPLFLGAVFVVAVISLAGATPLPRPRAELPEPPGGDFGKRLTPLPSSSQHKRQIFREQVSPHTGGKIPEDAFRADRLALNKLQQAGISVPDGVQLHWRGHGHNGEPGHHNSGPHGHPDGHTHNADPHFTIIQIVQPDDGRYSPPEGTANNQHPNTVDSTYALRTPAGWNQHATQLVGFQRPIGPPLQIPGTGDNGGSPLRRPFNPPLSQHHQSHPAPSPPPPPPPPPPQQQHQPQQHQPQQHQPQQHQPQQHQPQQHQPQQHQPQQHQPQQHQPQQQDDVNLTPFPSPALQPPPNVPTGNIPLFHHKPLPSLHPVRVHPLELPQPPVKPAPIPSVSPTPPPRPPPPPRKFHFGPVHIPHSLSPLIGIGSHHLSGPSRDLNLFSSDFESSHNFASSLLDDPSPFLLDDDWASEIPGGLLSPEQLAALYNSDHEERLQHLHSLTSF